MVFSLGRHHCSSICNRIILSRRLYSAGELASESTFLTWLGTTESQDRRDAPDVREAWERGEASDHAEPFEDRRMTAIEEAPFSGGALPFEVVRPEFRLDGVSEHEGSRPGS